MKKFLCFCGTALSASFIALACSVLFSCHRVQPSAGIPNPVKDSDSDAVSAALGKTFYLPENSSDESWSVISGNLYQLNYSWNGVECTARMEKTPEKEDISGLYYSWEKNTDEMLDEYPCTTRYLTVEDGNILAEISFYDESGISCSLSVKVPGLGPGDTDDIRKLLINLALETWGKSPKNKN